jgi:type IV pilus assembly protein PilO
MAWYNPAAPKQRNALLAGILLLALIYPFHSFWYQGQREEVDGMQERLETLEGQNRRAQVLAARGGGDLTERMALYERQVAKLEELIPAAEEVPVLLDDMSVRARQDGVDITRLLPEPAEESPYYNKTSYEVAVSGDYHAVGRFLTGVASLSRIVNPVELELAPHPQPQLFPEIEAPILATFRIETYVLPDQNASPPAAEGGSEG